MPPSLNKIAASATLHCLTGCAIGEVLGMVISSLFAWHAVPSVALSIALAFAFGYGLSMRPLVGSGMGLRRAVGLALAADSASIVTMEVVDNAFILAIPGAMYAGLSTALFWVSLTSSLAIAFAVAYPLNRWLIARGKGHAVLHQHHHHEHTHHY
jgi:hypothetical protein